MKFLKKFKEIKGDASFRKFYRNKKNRSIIVYSKKEKNKDLKEIHVDNLVETAFNNQLKIGVVPSEKNVMLGTPLEFELFEYMYLAKEYLDKK